MSRQFYWSANVIVDGEVADSNRADTYAEALTFAHDEIELICEYEDLDMTYAEVRDGELPASFDNGDTVPCRFHKELRQ